MPIDSTHDLLKKLYIQKMKAVEESDLEFLIKLEKQHPELFDKCFLYQMLQKELNITGQTLPIQLENILQKIIKSYRKTH